MRHGVQLRKQPRRQFESPMCALPETDKPVILSMQGRISKLTRYSQTGISKCKLRGFATLCRQISDLFTNLSKEYPTAEMVDKQTLAHAAPTRGDRTRMRDHKEHFA